MKEVQLRGLVLQKLYEQREKHEVMLKPEDFDNSLSIGDITRICTQLFEQDLIKATFVKALGGVPFLIASSINARGIDVIEGELTPNIGIDLMSNSTITISGSSNVVVGNNNSQHIQQNFHEIIKAIENSNATPEQKAEAKGLIRQIIENPIVNTLVGVGATALLGNL